MKKIIILIAALFLITGCDTPTDSYDSSYNITVENTTSYVLTISDSYGDFNTFTISAGETKVIKSNSSYISLKISQSQTTKIIDYEYTSDSKIRIYAYDYTVQYKITGTANTVNVTLNNPSGGTEQYSNVSVPKTYSYKYFADWFLYISAQNQGSSGSVTVSIYYKGNLFKSSSSSGAYVIATASGSK